MLLASPWPELLNAVAEGMLATGLLRIGSQVFRIRGARLLPPPAFASAMQWQPWGESAVVTSWSEPGQDRKRFIMPDVHGDLLFSQFGVLSSAFGVPSQSFVVSVRRLASVTGCHIACCDILSRQ